MFKFHLHRQQGKHPSCTILAFFRKGVLDIGDSRQQKNAFHTITFSSNLRTPSLHTLASVSSSLLKLDDKIDKDTICHFPPASYAARHWVNYAQFRNVALHIQEVMEHLFNAAKLHFSAWIWLHDIDHHWIESMSQIHPKRPEALPLYYAALTGLRDLVEHLMAVDSRDMNNKGGSYTTPLHAASVWRWHRCSLKMAQIPTLATRWARFCSTGCHRSDSSSWRSRHLRLRGSW